MGQVGLTVGEGLFKVELNCMKATIPLPLLTVLLGAGCMSVNDNTSIDSIVAPFTGPGLGGVAIAVVRNGEVVLKRGFGLADMEAGIPITSKTVFDLASLGKQFTGIAVLMLERRGKLSMNDDVRKYVPEVPVFDSNKPIRSRAARS